MGDVDGIAEAVETDGDTRDVAVGNGIDVLALDIAGLHVEAAMEVVGTGLTEIARQQHVVVYWRDKDIQKNTEQDR